MAFKFTSTAQKFFTQWRNGTNFDTVMTEFTNRLRGNAGDLVQVQETVTVECIVNELESLSFTYNSTDETIVCNGLDFISEGLFVGATIQVIQGVNEGESTVENITGVGFGTVYLDTTNLGFLTDGDHTDIVIRVKDAPTYMRYQYGCIPDSVRTDSEENYAGIDGNTQAYYLNDIITPSYELLDMVRFGRFSGWDMTRDLQVAFNTTADTYYHSYDIVHTFRIPYYKDGQQENIINQIPPSELAKTSTLKYANKIFLGYTSEVVGSVTKLGVTGDVGYYGENYNGKRANYSINTLTVTNSLGTGQISANVTNTVSINLTNINDAFTNLTKVIVQVFKLAISSEYTNNSTDTNDEIFLFDSVVQIAGRPAESSSILSNVEVTYNAVDDLDIDFNIDFTTDQATQTKSNDKYAIVVSTGDDGRPPDNEDNVSMVDVGLLYLDESKTDIIYDMVNNYYDSYAFNTGDRIFTNQATWNGCYVGFDLLFKMLQYTDGFKNRITKIESRMVLVNDADDQDFHVMWTKPLPLLPFANNYDSGGYSYQLISGSSNDNTNLASGEPLNFNQVRSLPPYPAGYQTIEVTGSVPRIPWREWIENLDLPNVFFDPAEENNNLNQRSSNYSGLNGYSIYHEIYIEVTNEKIQTVSANPDNLTTKPDPVIITPYHLRSDAFEVLDFDEDGNPSVTFTGEINIYDTLGNETDILSATEDRLIEVVITHDQGTLTLSDLWGTIWIEPVSATGDVVGQLHSSKDFTYASNALTGSQEVSASNFDYVEIVSDLNVVYLYCSSVPQNIISGAQYNIYYRLGKKTL